MKCGSCHEFCEVQNIINVHTLSHFYYSSARTVLTGLTAILFLFYNRFGSRVAFIHSRICKYWKGEQTMALWKSFFHSCGAEHRGPTVLSNNQTQFLSLIAAVIRKAGVWFVPQQQASPLSTSAPDKAVYKRLLTEKQISKLDLCAWHNWLIGGLHGWVWWGHPRRITDLWWPAFSFLDNC